MKYSREITAVALKTFINADQLVKINYAFMNVWDIDCRQAKNDKLFVDILKNGFEFQCRKPVTSVKIAPLCEWLADLECNLLDYTKTTYDKWLDPDLYINEGYIRLDILQYEQTYNSIVMPNSVQSIKFDFRASCFEYWDEFGLVIQSKNIYDLLSDFHKLHPSIEIPELHIS